MPAAFGFMRSRSEGPAADFFRWGRRLDFTERSSRLGVDGAFGDRDATEKNLLTGITRADACHHCGRRNIPSATLTNGLMGSTIGGSATVPGCPTIVHSVLASTSFWTDAS